MGGWPGFPTAPVARADEVLCEGGRGDSSRKNNNAKDTDLCPDLRRDFAHLGFSASEQSMRQGCTGSCTSNGRDRDRNQSDPRGPNALANPSYFRPKFLIAKPK
jgi:hypothetical protein